MKKILILSSLLSGLLFASQTTITAEYGENVSIDLPNLLGCGEGRVTVLGFIGENKDVNYTSELNASNDLHIDVTSRVSHKNWELESYSEEFSSEGKWILEGNYKNLVFHPAENFTEHPSILKYSITEADSCSDQNGTLALRYYKGEHFNNEDLPTGAVVDTINYVDSHSKTLDVLSNDINPKNIQRMVLVKSFWNSSESKYSCYPDSIYALDLNGSNLDENNRTLYGNITEINSGSKTANLSVVRELLTDIYETGYTKNGYYGIDGTWTVSDLRVKFTPSYPNLGQVHSENHKRIAHIGYMAIDKDGVPGQCEVIKLTPKSILNNKINVPVHSGKNINVDALDNTDSLELAHGAVVKESLGFYPSGEKLLTVDGEGTWIVTNDFNVSFRPFPSFDYLRNNPTMVQLQANINNGNDLSNIANLSIFYPIKANYDSSLFSVNFDTVVSVLENDTGNIDLSTLELIPMTDYLTLEGNTYLNNDNVVVEVNLTKEENNASKFTLTSDAQDLYVEGEGHWKVIADKVTFYPEEGFVNKPSRIAYQVKDYKNKVSYGVIDLDLAKGNLLFKAFYDLNKNGVLDRGENPISGVRVIAKDVTDSEIEGYTSNLGELDLELIAAETGVVVSYPNEDGYVVQSSEMNVTVTKDETLTVSIPVVKLSGTLQFQAFLDKNNNKTLDEGEERLKDVDFLINGLNHSIQSINGEDKNTSLNTGSSGMVEVPLDEGVYSISIVGVTFSVTIVDGETSDLVAVIPVKEVEEPDSLISSESSVPALPLPLLVLLASLTFFIHKRKQ